MKTILIFLAVTLLITVKSNAQWTKCDGSFGGFVRSIAVIDSTLFAGSDGGGVYVSYNKGENWNEIYSILNRSDIKILKAMDTMLFAVTKEGIFRSNDKAQNWISVNSELKEVREFIVSGTKIYAMAQPLTQTMTPKSTLYCSTDRGDTWNEINTEVPDKYYLFFTVKDSILIVSNYEKGIYRSTDNGGSWTEISSGLKNKKTYSITECNSSLFLCCDNSEIYRSIDNGDNWLKVNSGMPKYEYSYYSMLVAGNKIFAQTPLDRLYSTPDNGDSWHEMTIDSTNLVGFFRVALCLAEVDSTLFAGTNGMGIYRGKKGENWELVNNGLTNYFVRSFAKNSATLFAGIEDLGMFKSTDNGTSWSKVKEDFGFRNIFSITTKNDTVFAGAYLGSVYMSVDNGESWKKVDSGLVEEPGITHITTIGNVIFAETFAGLYRSTNNGGYWKALDEFKYRSINSFSVSDSVIYAALETEGIARSTDKGESWTFSIPGGDRNRKVNAVVAYGSTVFAGMGTYGGKVYRSKDYGVSWTDISNGLQGRNIASLAFENNKLFAGTFDGVFYSSNLGDNWTDISSGLTDKYMYSMIISGSRILAGTGNSGIRKLELSTLSVNETKYLQSKNTFLCYPNPASNTLTIDRTTLQFPENAPVHYTLSTIVGEKVMEFNNSEPKFSVPLEGIASGVYNLTAVSGKARASVMVTVVE